MTGAFASEKSWGTWTRTKNKRIRNGPPPQSRATGEADPALQPCVDAAVTAGNHEWVCTGEGLTVTRDASNKKVNQFTSIDPIEVESTLDPSKTTETAKGGDFYDTWCEYGSVCSRNISSYISETKGNAAYGNQNGVIGAYDTIIRTNLNGRSAQWKVTLIWDSGPNLTFTSAKVACIEKALWGYVNCGNHTVSGARLDQYNYRWTSPTLYGNYLSNSNPYFGDWVTYFTPTGYPQYRAAELYTTTFNCYGSDRCYFP